MRTIASLSRQSVSARGRHSWSLQTPPAGCCGQRLKSALFEAPARLAFGLSECFFKHPQPRWIQLASSRGCSSRSSCPRRGATPILEKSTTSSLIGVLVALISGVVHALHWWALAIAWSWGMRPQAAAARFLALLQPATALWQACIYARFYLPLPAVFTEFLTAEMWQEHICVSRM